MAKQTQERKGETPLTILFALLANDTRVTVLREITRKSQADLAKELGFTRPAISAYVTRFKDVGLLKEIKGKSNEGEVTRYELTPDGVDVLTLVENASPLAERLRDRMSIKKEEEAFAALKQSVEGGIVDKKDASRLFAKAISRGSFKSPVVRKIKEYLEELQTE